MRTLSSWTNCLNCIKQISQYAIKCKLIFLSYRASTVPVTVLRKRELKWLDMLENWEKWMSKRFKKVYQPNILSFDPHVDPEFRKMGGGVRWKYCWPPITKLMQNLNKTILFF